MKFLISSMMISIFLFILFDSAYAQQSNNDNNFQNICVDEELCKQHAVEWWKWAYSIPEENNPGLDKTGVNCDLGNQGSTWYLIGTFDATPVNRDCTIPSNMDLFFPIYNSNCSYIEFPLLKTDEELIKCAIDFQSKAIGLKATLNGTLLPSSSITTNIFDFSLPDNNIFGVPPGNYEGAGSGEFVGIGSLEPGYYILIFSGTTQSTATSLNDFMQENVYRLHITP